MKTKIVVKPFRRIINQPKLINLVESVNGRAATAGPIIALGNFAKTHETLGYQMFNNPTECSLYAVSCISIITTISMMTYNFEKEERDKYERFETAIGRVAMGFWLSLMLPV